MRQSGACHDCSWRRQSVLRGIRLRLCATQVFLIQHGSLSRGKKVPETSFVCVTIAVGNNYLRKHLSGRLGTEPPEGRLRLCVPIRDEPVCVHSHECIKG